MRQVCEQFWPWQIAKVSCVLKETSGNQGLAFGEFAFIRPATEKEESKISLLFH
jgi:hypothetical protein